MATAELLELAKAGKFDDFEARALELLEAGALRPADLLAAADELERNGQVPRISTLVQMLLENQPDARSDPKTLKLACRALLATPDNAAARGLVADLYQAQHGATPGFELALQASGLAGGRPVRMALKLLELSLTLQPGETLISRMDDRVVEVSEVDRERGLFTLRDSGATVTRPAPEVVRDFDRIAADDFRVIRALRPDSLADLLTNDPERVIIGLIHAHGGHIDAEQLKAELVPDYLPAGAWSKWWTSARNKLKKNPHVLIEGRSPVILTYTAEAQSLEEETWETFASKKFPTDWLSIAEGYLREKAALKETPDVTLLERLRAHLMQNIETARATRPAEALETALVLAALQERGLPDDGSSKAAALALLQKAAAPERLLAALGQATLQERGLDWLQEARPADWGHAAIRWLPTAPAGLLDKLVSGAVAAGHATEVQQVIDAAVGDAPRFPEIICWLWKGPRGVSGLTLPTDDALFIDIVEHLSSLGRSVTADPTVVKNFRHRMRATLALRNFARVQECLQRTSAAAAVTLRRQLERLEGMGQTTQAALVDMLRDVHPQLWAVKPQRIEPWADATTVWTTADGLRKRTAERDDIVNVQMRDNARRIGEAASHGDLSENSEYKFALEERDLLRARLAKINEELSLARALEVHDVPESKVGIGSRVTLRRTDDRSERVMTFLGPFDTDVERGIFSYQAPFAQKLMGRQAGERVTVTLDGRDVELEIVSAVNALQDAPVPASHTQPQA